MQCFLCFLAFNLDLVHRPLCFCAQIKFRLHWTRPYFLQEYTSVDGSPLPRCNSQSYYSASSASRTRCPADMVVNPTNVFKIIENSELRKASEYYEAVQVKPQHVSLKLRISNFRSFQNLQRCWPFFDFRWSSWLGLLLRASPRLPSGFILSHGLV